MSVSKSHLLLCLAFAMISSSLIGCSAKKLEHNYPQNRDEREEARLGKLTDDGLLSFGKKKGSGADGYGITVNAYLWRASLETVAFMPLASTDPFGGVILTDWYSFESSPNERFKLNVMITSSALRSDAIQVKLFKQVRKASEWVDAAVPASMASAIEEQILLQARKLRVSRAL